jgi:hypothetical protein
MTAPKRPLTALIMLGHKGSLLGIVVSSPNAIVVIARHGLLAHRFRSCRRI